MKTYIHVNQHKIRANKKHGIDGAEVLLLREERKTNSFIAKEAKILSPATVKYGGTDKPFAGARVVIETEEKRGEDELQNKRNLYRRL